jgi:hypothetical protein
MGHKSGKLRGYTSSDMTHCESPAKQGCLKGTNPNSGYSGLKFIPGEKANAIADCLENHLTHHDLCDEHHERRVVTLVQEILETEDTPPTEENYHVT